jgi:NADPH:quinone reductase-like Zn-dependent oxidoreductase
MKAITTNEFGSIDKLIFTELPKPILSEGEVLIKVGAISINPVDVRTRAGSAMAQHLKHFNPLILGWDISGTVMEIGNNVSGIKCGDEVFGLVNFLGHGKGYAEYVAAPAEQLAIKPLNISFEEAAAATLAALTAWQLLVGYAHVKAGDKILVQAASGGVGHYLVQIAKYFGAYVVGVSSSKNREFVLSLGADEHIAYDQQNFEDEVKDADIVIDAFAFENLYRSLQAVKPGGKIISLLPMISEDLLQKAKEKGVEVHYELVRSDGEGMKAIANMLTKQKLRSHISKTFSFDDMAKAHTEMETGRTTGKIVVTL